MLVLTGVTRCNAIWIFVERLDDRLSNFFLSQRLLCPKALFDYIEEDIHAAAQAVSITYCSILFDLHGCLLPPLPALFKLLYTP